MVDGIPMTHILKGQLIARQRIIALQTEAFCAFSPMKRNDLGYRLAIFEILLTSLPLQIIHCFGAVAVVPINIQVLSGGGLIH